MDRTKKVTVQAREQSLVTNFSVIMGWLDILDSQWTTFSDTERRMKVQRLRRTGKRLEDDLAWVFAQLQVLQQSESVC